MFSLGFSEFLKNIKNNILVLAELILIYVAAIFMMSAISEQYSLINGIKTFFDRTGTFVKQDTIAAGTTVTDEELLENLTGVERIVRPVETNLYGEIDGNRYNLNFITNNSDYVKSIPRLTEGRWCEDAEHEDGIINIVLSDNVPFKVPVGDIVNLEGYNFRVTGYYGIKEMVFGLTNTLNTDGSESYISMYGTVNEFLEYNDPMSEYYAIASYEDVNREMKDRMYSGLFMIIDYYDDLSEQDIEKNMDILCTKFNYTADADMFDMRNIYTYSMELLRIKFVPVAVIFGLTFILTLTCIFNAASLNVMREQHNYGIYFICGNNWKNTVILSFMHWVCLSVTALIAAGVISAFVRVSNLYNGLAFSFGWMNILSLTVITVLILIFAVLLPFVMLRKMQPVNILRNNE